MPVDAETEAYRAATVAISAAAAAHALQAFSTYIDLAQLLLSFDAWEREMAPVLARAAERNSDLALRDYVLTRRAAGITTAPPGWEPALLDLEMLRRSLYSTAGQTLEQVQREELDPAHGLTRARQQVVGVSTRYAMNGARNSTIAATRRDRDAIGAVYITRGDADVCFWCAMLASRGPVFKDYSWEGTDAKFFGTGNAKSHDNCRCVLKVVYRSDTALLDDARALYNEWKKVNWTDDGKNIKNSGKKAIREWRAYWEKSR